MEKFFESNIREDEIYKFWQDNEFYKAISDKRKPFSISMPPPNVTGQLHMGHALDQTLQDILTRYHRMLGENALWVPGVDHAGIATQIKVEEELRKNGITRFDLGREKFLEKVWEWKKKYGDRIVHQCKRLGSSCDWSKSAFTMDDGYAKAVKKVFVNLYNKGAIYQGVRIINWCPSCLTALSDAEVEYKDEASHFWNIKYKLVDGTGEIVVATTRPETLFGDMAVVVNKDDERYKDMIGKEVYLPLTDRTIPILTDEHAKMDMGTGAVKITPSHDPNDFLVAERLGLPQLVIMNDNGTLNEHTGKYEGLDRYVAREKVVEDLEGLGLIDKIEKHEHSVGCCYRCSNTVEPLASKQWFVKMEELAKPAIEAVKNDVTEFVPKRFEKIYFNWLENIRDWCISRQLWWGHRIPAFTCDTCGWMGVSEEDIDICPKCGAKTKQEEDVLDTWFSSALWPFAILGWPDKTADLDYYYPNDVLVTGYDIIFFWVVRMMFSGLEHMDEIPFQKVLIHGIVRDSQGRKMSKSLGNGIDPLDIIEKYGADSLRGQLVTNNSPGNDMRFVEAQTEAARNFTNKLWNATKFYIMNKSEDSKIFIPNELNPEDEWILSKLNSLSQNIENNMKNFEIGVCYGNIESFIWNDLCDNYIEMIKPRLRESDENAIAIMGYVLDASVKFLHPFMPFITEEIYQIIHGYDYNTKSTISTAPYPKYNEAFNYDTAKFDMAIKLAKRDKELETLQKEKTRLEKEISIFTKKLSNESYVNNAPKAVVDKDREKLANYEALLIDVKGQLDEL